MSWPIIIVTGANGGVGFGICQRLLCQLSQTEPSDTRIRPTGFTEVPEDNGRDADQFVLPCEGLTLIMACRSLKRAEIARQKLLKILDRHVEKQRKIPGYDGHADTFRRNVRIDICALDLVMLSTIPEFVENVSKNYPYISHLICNAGVAPFSGIDWLSLFKQLLASPMQAVTAPKYYYQNWGEISMDGYGWVWQCNVFGHYTLYRALSPMLNSPRYPRDTRVIWTSSLEARRTYDPEDWQLKQTKDPYGSSKYQTELIAAQLDHLSLSNTPESSKRVRHFIAHPGVCHTSIDLNLIVPVLHYLKHYLFYFARFLGSYNHTIDLDKGAVSVVWLSIISLASLSIFEKSENKAVKSSSSGNPVKFGAQTDRWGNPRVGVEKVRDWESNRLEAVELVENCEQLYQSFTKEQSEVLEIETASERM